MKHEYRVTLPLVTYVYARNGLELDRTITNCITNGVAPEYLSILAIIFAETKASTSITLSARDQMILTANALHNMARDNEAIRDVLRAHADDLMRAASTE